MPNHSSLQSLPLPLLLLICATFLVDISSFSPQTLTHSSSTSPCPSHPSSISTSFSLSLSLSPSSLLLSVSGQSLPTPVVTSVSPLWILPHTNVTIDGSNFRAGEFIYYNYINLDSVPPSVDPRYQTDNRFLPLVSDYSCSGCDWTMPTDSIFWRRLANNVRYGYFWYTCPQQYYVNSTRVICTIGDDPVLSAEGLRSKMVFAYGYMDEINNIMPVSKQSSYLPGLGEPAPSNLGSASVSSAPHDMAVGFYAPALASIQLLPQQGQVDGSTPVTITVTLTSGLTRAVFSVDPVVAVAPSGTTVSCSSFTWIPDDSTATQFQCVLITSEVGRYRWKATMDNGYVQYSPPTASMTYLANDAFTSIWQPLSSYQWIEDKPTGPINYQVFVNPYPGFGARSMRFFIPATTLTGTARSLVFRFHKGTYTIEYASVAFSYRGDNSGTNGKTPSSVDVLQHCVAQLFFPVDDGPPSPSATATLYANLDSLPVSMCMNPSMPVDIAISIHVAEGNFVPILHTFDSTESNIGTTFVWDLAHYTTSYAPHMADYPYPAANPIDWHVSKSKLGVQTGVYPPMEAIFAVQGELSPEPIGGCGTWPTISAVHPMRMQVNALHPLSITLTGATFSGTIGSNTTQPIAVTYGLLNSAPYLAQSQPLPGSEYACTNVTLRSSTELTCIVSNVLPLTVGQQVHFQLTVGTSTNGHRLVSLPSAVATLNDLNTNVAPLPSALLTMIYAQDFEGVTLYPPAGPTNPMPPTYPELWYAADILILSWPVAPTDLFANLTSGKAKIGYLAPPDDAYSSFTPCNGVQQGATQYKCTAFWPYEQGRYIMMIAYDDGVNVTAPLPYGAFYSSTNFTPVWEPTYPATSSLVLWGTTNFRYPRRNPANDSSQIRNMNLTNRLSRAQWTQQPPVTLSGPGVIRSLIPAANLLNPSSGIQIMLYAGDQGLTFDSLSIAPGRAPNSGYYSAQPMKLTFNGQTWESAVSIAPSQRLISDPIYAFCNDPFDTDAYDLIVSFHVRDVAPSLLFYNMTYPENPTTTQAWFQPDAAGGSVQHFLGTFIYQIISLGPRPEGLPCARASMSNISITSILPNRPLVAIIEGSNFIYSGPNAALQTPPTPIVSYWLTQDLTMSYELGNAFVCQDVTIQSNTQIRCVLTALNSQHFGSNISFVIYAYGQLSGPFNFTLLPPSSPRLTQFLTVAPASGPRSDDPLTLTLRSSIHTDAFKETTMGVITPLTGMYVPCTPFAIDSASDMNCTFIPAELGVYKLQLGFSTGINYTTEGSMQTYRSCQQFDALYASDLTYPPTSTGLQLTMLPSAGNTTYRFALPRNYPTDPYYNTSYSSSRVLLRLMASVSSALVGYNFSGVSIGLGISFNGGSSDVLPSSVVQVTFGMRAKQSGVDTSSPGAILHEQVTDTVEVPPNIAIDSDPIDFCLRPQGYTSDSEWEPIITLYSNASSLPALQHPTNNVPEPVLSRPGPALPLVPLWSHASDVTALSKVASIIVDSLYSIDPTPCDLPLITSITPSTGFGRLRQNVTLHGSGLDKVLRVSYGIIGLASPPGYGSWCEIVEKAADHVICTIQNDISIGQSIRFIAYGNGTRISPPSAVHFQAIPYPVWEESSLNPMSGEVGQTVELQGMLGTYTAAFLKDAAIGFVGTFGDSLGVFTPCYPFTVLADGSASLNDTKKFTCTITTQKEGLYRLHAMFQSAFIPYNVTAADRRASIAVYRNVTSDFVAPIQYPEMLPNASYEWRPLSFAAGVGESEGMWHRFTLPVGSPSVYGNGLFLRLAPSNMSYAFDSMTVAWGSMGEARTFPESGQLVQFFGLAYGTTIQVQPNQTVDSDAVSLCIPEGNRLWSLVITFHTAAGAQKTIPGFTRINLADGSALAGSMNVAFSVLDSNLGDFYNHLINSPSVVSMLVSSVHVLELTPAPVGQPLDPFTLASYPIYQGDGNCSHLQPRMDHIEPFNIVIGSVTQTITIHGSNLLALRLRTIDTTGAESLAPFGSVIVRYGSAGNSVLNYSTQCLSLVLDASTLSLTCTIDTTMLPRFSFLTFVMLSGSFVSNAIRSAATLVPNYHMTDVIIRNPHALTPTTPLILNSTATALSPSTAEGMFTGNRFFYSVYVPYVTSSVTVTVTQQDVNNPAQLSLYGPSSPASNPVQTATFTFTSPSLVSDALSVEPLASDTRLPTINYVVIYSPQDDLPYNFSLVVASPDMMFVEVDPFPEAYIIVPPPYNITVNEGGNITTKTIQPPPPVPLSVVATPAQFTNDVRTYTIKVSYVCTHINISALLRTVGTVTVVYEGGSPVALDSVASSLNVTDPTAPPPPVNSTQPVPTITYYHTSPLMFAINTPTTTPVTTTVTVKSELDGDYAYTIQRIPADVAMITIDTLDVFGVRTHVPITFIYGSLTSPTYVHTLPYRVAWCNVSVTFGTPHSVYLSVDPPIRYGSDGTLLPVPDSYSSQLAPLNTTIPSSMLNLLIGENPLRINSLMDGNYSLTLVRSEPDLNHIEFTGTDWLNEEVSIPFPAFVPGTYFNAGYNLTVPSNVHWATLKLIYTTSGSISLTWKGTDPTQDDITFKVANDTMMKLPRQLDHGSNQLIIHSSVDGIYTINIIRQPSDFLPVPYLLGLMPSTNSLSDNLLNLATPTFEPGHPEYLYTIDAGFGVFNLTVNATFHTPSNVANTTLIVHPGESDEFRQNLTSGVPSKYTILRFGLNVVNLISPIDGSYLFHIYRSTPDLLRLDWAPQSTDGVPVPGSLNFRDPPEPFDSYRFHYHASVFFSQFRVSPIIQFLTSNTVTLVHQYTAMVPISPGSDSMVPEQRQAVQTNIANNTFASPGFLPFFNLTVGNNFVSVQSSRDGVYTLEIERASPDLSAVSMRAVDRGGNIAAVNYTPTYQPDIYTYDLLVNYKYVKLSTQVTFASNSTLQLSAVINGSVVMEADSRSGEWTEYVRLTDAPSQILISSSFDGLYTFRIVRRPPNIEEILLKADKESPKYTSRDPMQLQQPLTPGIFNYTSVVNYIAYQFSFTLKMRDAWDNTSVTYRSVATSIDNNGTVSFNETVLNISSVTADQVVGPFPLALGSDNLLRIESNNDGVYYIRITRRQADMRSIGILGRYPASLLPQDAHTILTYHATLLPAPGFIPGRLEYEMYIPYVVSSFDVYIAYADPNDEVIVDLAPGTDPGFSGNDSLTEGFSLQPYPTLTDVYVTVKMDGVYAVHILHQQPDVRELHLQSLPTSLLLAESLPVALYPTTASAIPLQYIVPPPTDVTPAFTPGSMLYTAHLPANMAFIAASALWNDVGENLTIDCNNSPAGGLLLTNNTDLYPTINGSLIVSNASSIDAPLLPLLPGVVNVVRVRSALDGVYTISVSRGNLSLSLSNLPPVLYANRTTPAMHIHLSGGVRPESHGGSPLAMELIVNISSTIGQVIPSSIDLSGLSGYGVLDSRNFFLVAPEYLDSTREAMLTFSVSGRDAWQVEPHTPASFNVTLVPTNVTHIANFTLDQSTLPPPILLGKSAGGIIVTAEPQGRPDPNNTLTLHIGCTDGRITPSEILWTRENWMEEKTFTYTAPTRIVNDTCFFALTGVNENNHNNPQQYIPPQPFVVTVLGYVSLTASSSIPVVTAPGSSLPLYSLYSNELSAPFSLRPIGLLHPNLRLDLSSPTVSSGFSVSIQPSWLTWEGYRYNNEQRYDDKDRDSANVQTFRIQSSSGSIPTEPYVITVNVALSGVFDNGDGFEPVGKWLDDSRSYVSLPSISFAILPQAAITLSNFPGALYAGELSAPISLQLAAPPNANRMVRISMDTNGTGTLYPPFVQMLADETSLRPLSFQYRAPAQPQSVSFTFSIEGSDAAHYLPLSVRTLHVLPLASVIISSPSASLYTDGSLDLHLEATTLPPRGIAISISLTTLIAGEESSIAGATLSESIVTFAASMVSDTRTEDQVLHQTVTLTARRSVCTLILDFRLSGYDVSLFDPVLPSLHIPVLSAGSWFITGLRTSLPTSAVLTAPIAFTVQPSRQPLDRVTFRMEMLSSSSGSFDPNQLEFTRDTWSVVQKVTFTPASIPMVAAMRCTIGGDSAGAFDAPADTNLTFLAPILFNNVPSTVYAAQESTSITVEIDDPATQAPLDTYPFDIRLSCDVPSCTFSPPQLVVSSKSDNTLTFKVQAPPLPAGSVPRPIQISAWVSSGNGLAARYFHVPHSPLALSVLPQATFSVTAKNDPTNTNLTVYAFGSLTLSIQPTASTTEDTRLLIRVPSSNGMSLGKIDMMESRMLSWQKDSMSALEITYQAPDYTIDPQLIPLNLTAYSMVGDVSSISAQFAIPSTVLIMAGPMVLPTCKGSSKLFISGFRSDEAYRTGLYSASKPNNGRPHYQFATVTSGGIPKTVHFFYDIPTVQTDPPSWMIDESITSIHPTAYVNTHAQAPFSSSWARRDEFSTEPTPVPGLTVACGAECSAIGTNRSLETMVCFGGRALLDQSQGPTPTSTPTPTYCPLSCARYLPSLVSQCSDTPFYRQQPVVQHTLDALNSAQLCGRCDFNMISNMMQTCGVTLSGSDLTQDMLTVMELPSTCSSSCAASYVSFYETCVLTQPSIPTSFTQLYSKCISAKPPNPVEELKVLARSATSITLGWNAATQVQSQWYPVMYTLEMSTNNNVTNVSSFHQIWQNEDVMSVVGGLDADRQYAFRLRVSSTAGLGAYSPILVTRTRSLPPTPPPASNITLGSMTLFKPDLPAATPTYNTTCSWRHDVAMEFGSTLFYRLYLTSSPEPALIGSTTPPTTWSTLGVRLMYAGAASSSSSVPLHDLLPGTWYRLSLSSAIRDVNGSMSAWSNSTQYTFSTQQLPPSTPTLLWPTTTNKDVTSSSVTLRWPIVPWCGVAACSGVQFTVYMQSRGRIGQTQTQTNGAWNVAVSNIPMPNTDETNLAAIPAQPINTKITGLSPGNVYAFRLTASSAAGSSGLSSIVHASTTALSPHLLQMGVVKPGSKGKIYVVWNNSAPFIGDGGADIEAVTFTAQSTTTSSHSVEHTILMTDAIRWSQQAVNEAGGSMAKLVNYAPSFIYTLTDLSGGELYEINMRIRNRVGWSNSSSLASLISVPSAPVRFLSLVASDPTGSNTRFAPGCTIVATFDQPTNTPSVATQAEIGALIQFNQPIPATYSGAWSTDGRTLTITIGPLDAPDSVNHAPVIGSFSARIIGSLLSQDGRSADLRDESESARTQILLGAWASQPPSQPHLLPFTSVPIVNSTVVDYYALGFRTNPDASYPTDHVASMTVRAFNGRLAYPWYPGRNPEVDGLPSMARLNSFTITVPYAAFTSTDPTINPLLAMTYTPGEGFYGIDQVSVSISDVSHSATPFPAEYVLYPFRVDHVNRRPKIILPSVAPVYDVLNEDGVKLSGLKISDADNFMSTIISMTITPINAIRPVFTLPQALPTNGLSCNIPSPAYSSSRLSLYGEYGLVQKYLSQYVRFRDVGLDVDARDPILFHVMVDDLGSGIDGAMSLIATARYSMIPACMHAPSPKLLSAQWSDDLGSVTLRFDAAIKLVYPFSLIASNADLNDCALYVDATTLAMLASSANLESSTRCFQSSSETLTIKLGLGATLAVGSIINLNPASTIVRRCRDALTFTTEGSVPLLAPLHEMRPSVLLQAPSSTSACASLTLATRLTNLPATIQPDQVLYEWSATDGSGNDTIDLLYAAIEFANNGTGRVLDESSMRSLIRSSDHLVIPAGHLRAGATYTFSVSIHTPNGLRSEISWTSVDVAPISTPVPLLFPTTPIHATVSFAAPIHLIAHASTPTDAACTLTLPPGQQQLRFAWKVQQGDQAGPIMLQRQSRTASILIEPGLLQPDKTYTVTLIAAFVYQMSSQATLVYTLHTLSADAALPPSVLYMHLTPSSTGMLPFMASAQMRSLLRSGVHLPLQWACRPVDAVTDDDGDTAIGSDATSDVVTTTTAYCFNATSKLPVATPLTDPSSSNKDLRLPSGTLVPGEYVWSAMVRLVNGSEEEWTPATIVHLLVSETSESGSESTEEKETETVPQLQLHPSTSLLDVSDHLRIESSFILPNGSSIDPSASSNAYVYRWSLQGSEGGDFSSIFSDSDVTHGVQTPILGINAPNEVDDDGVHSSLYGSALFPPCALLTFRLSVWPASVSMSSSASHSFAEVSVHVRCPPSGGSLSVSPSTGVADLTVFKVSAQGWHAANGAGGVLYYSYSITAGESGAQASSTLDTTNIPFGKLPGSPAEEDTISISGVGAAHAITLTLTITDQLGSQTRVSKVLSVLPPAGDAFSTLSLSGLISLGDSLHVREELANTTGAVAQLISYANARAKEVAILVANLSTTTASSSVVSTVSNVRHPDPPRCTTERTPLFSPETIWIPPLTQSLSTRSLMSGNDPSIPPVTTAAAAVTTVRNILDAVEPYLAALSSSSSSPSSAASSGASFYGDSTTIQPLSLCHHLASNPALYQSIDASDPLSTSLAARLLNLCHGVISQALEQVQTMCQMTTLVTPCKEAQAEVLRETVRAIVSTMHMHHQANATYSAAMVAQQQQQASTARRRLLSSYSSIDLSSIQLNTAAPLVSSTYDSLLQQALDLHSSLGLLVGAGSSISLPDCLLPSAIHRTLNTDPRTQHITFDDGSSVTYPYAFSAYPTTQAMQKVPMHLVQVEQEQPQVQPQLMQVGASSSVDNAMLVDTQVTYSQMIPPTWSRNQPPVRLLTGMMSSRRILAQTDDDTDNNSNMGTLSVPVSAGVSSSVSDPIVYSLSYSTNDCSSPCVPLCVVWDSGASMWYNSTDPWASSYLYTRYPSSTTPSPATPASTTSYVDCLVYGRDGLTVAAVAWDDGSGLLPQTSTGMDGMDTSSSSSSSSTGSSDMSDPDGDGVCASCYGPLDGPPPDNSSLPYPSYQSWAVNATLVSHLAPSAIPSDLHDVFIGELSNATGIPVSRFYVASSMQAPETDGSTETVMLTFLFYILPSSNTADTLPQVIYADLYAQSMNSSSRLSRESLLTGAAAASTATTTFTLANYFPATICEDGLYRPTCDVPDDGGSKDSSSGGTSGDELNSTGPDPGEAESAAPFLEGDNLTLFIAAMAGGVPLLILLALALRWIKHKDEGRKKLDEESSQGGEQSSEGGESDSRPEHVAESTSESEQHGSGHNSSRSSKNASTDSDPSSASATVRKSGGGGGSGGDSSPTHSVRRLTRIPLRSLRPLPMHGGTNEPPTLPTELDDGYGYGHGHEQQTAMMPRATAPKLQVQIHAPPMASVTGTGTETVAETGTGTETETTGTIAELSPSHEETGIEMMTTPSRPVGQQQSKMIASPSAPSAAASAAGAAGLDATSPSSPLFTPSQSLPPSSSPAAPIGDIRVHLPTPSAPASRDTQNAAAAAATTPSPASIRSPTGARSTGSVASPLSVSGSNVSGSVHRTYTRRFKLTSSMVQEAAAFTSVSPAATPSNTQRQGQ